MLTAQDIRTLQVKIAKRAAKQLKAAGYRVSIKKASGYVELEMTSKLVARLQIERLFACNKPDPELTMADISISVTNSIGGLPKGKASFRLTDYCADKQPLTQKVCAWIVAFHRCQPQIKKGMRLPRHSHIAHSKQPGHNRPQIAA